MKQIIKMSTVASELLREQIVAPETKLRPMAFVLSDPVEEGTLLYHNMTKEMLLLSEEEYRAFCEEDGPTEIRDYLIRHWFLVPEEEDDCALSDEIREVDRLFQEGGSDGKITGFTILTTTECNARCFYCFEKDYKRESMTDETAHKVVQYILRNHTQEKPFRLSWIGGEPLFNSRVIDLICSELSVAGCDFFSAFTTNGYLFDAETLEIAVRDWRTSSVQITLDGTEEIYNRTKAYIYKDEPNPFRRVVGNIKALLKAGVHVEIRLNAGPANIEDIEKLCTFLKEEFSGLGDLRIYVQCLYQYLPRVAHGELESFRLRKEALDAWLIEEGFEKSVSPLDGAVQFSHCTADIRKDVVIKPDGKLSKCHCVENGPEVGSVDSDVWDEEAFAEWCRIKKADELCRRCVKYPTCIWLLHCEPLKNDICTPRKLEKHEATLRLRMEKSYRDYLAAAAESV